jgi:hypothetical protein
VPADYEQIRQDNRDRYGWDTAVLDLLGQLYSERTHFIFELLQNAEDAGATGLTFELFDDRLQVRHDGRLFTEADVHGVCGIGKSPKFGDLTKIGKFGIGFKSVYAYTKTPQVHSGDENFRIEKYVQPYAVQPLDEPAEPGDEHAPRTLFVFPFNHDDPSAATAEAEISAALADLDPATLLFLRKTKRIRIRGPLVADAVLERVDNIGPTSSSRQILLKSDHGRDDEAWLVWGRQLPQHLDLRVEVAFRSITGQGKPRLVKAASSPLVVFFPTAKDTSLGFLIQGPYRTTPARDNVPGHDSWNQSLVDETAILLADVLRELRDAGLLTVEVLQALPIDAERFQPRTMFRPLFDAVLESVDRDRLIPLAAGGYGSAAELKLARGAGLRELFPPELLGELYGSSGPVSFAAESVTENRTPVLWHYLRKELQVDEVTPEAVVNRVTSDFLAARPDRWIGQFYAFLLQNPALWRPKRNWYEEPGPARTKPIIRLEDGSHILPFTPAGRPAAYLPGRTETEFPTVRREVAEIPEARHFLEALTFTEPDVVTEVLEKVLPRYASLDVQNLDSAQHEADLDHIASALNTVNADRRKHLREQLRGTAFLVGENAVTGQRQLMTPPALYWRSADMEIYLDGNPDGWFLADGYQPWSGELTSLGAREEPAVHARKSDSRGHVIVADYHGQHERGLDRFDPAAHIDDLEFAMRNPDRARSEYIWNNLLSPNQHLIDGTVESSSRQGFINASREHRTSPIGAVATAEAWLPGTDGAFHRPEEFRVDDLPADYRRDEALARALGMIQPVVEEASRQLGLPPDVLRGLSEHPDLVVELQQKLKERVTGTSMETNPGAEAGEHVAGGPEPGPGEETDYISALSDAFSRSGKPVRDPEDAAPAAGIVSHPEFRRSRVQETIAGEKADEPLQYERFRQVPRRVWEAKDSSVRQFLLEQYSGRCQICSQTFIKRDNAPYFEGVYLVSRTHARWIDRPGNVICLCATCCAKFQYGTVVADDILPQIVTWRTQREGGSGPRLTLQLCGEDVALEFTEKHLLDLQEIIKAELP